MQAMDQSGSSTGANAIPVTAIAAPSTPESTESPAPSPTPDASPRFAPLTVGPPIELPEGVVLYVWGGCTGCDTPAGSLRRIERSGDEVEEQILWEAATDNTAPYLLQTADPGWVDEDVLYVFECSTGYCGGVGEATADASVTLYRSVDDGVTWESLGAQSLPPNAVAARPDPADWGVTRPILAPAQTADGTFEVEGIPIDLTILDDRGLPDGYLASVPEFSSDGRLALRWFVTLPSGTSIPYLSVFATDGTPIATYSSTYLAAKWLDTDRLVTTIVFDPGGRYQSPDVEYGWIPSIIDLRNGTVRPLLDAFGSVPLNRNQVMGVRGE